jgi:hypothetical protein
MAMNVPSRWFDWEPQTRIFSKCPKGAPTKPPKPSSVGFVGSLQNLGGEGSVGFVGPYQGQIQKIEGEPDPAELSRASVILGQAGIRLMRLETGDAVGVWSDLDSPAIRNALHSLGSGELPVLYLDGPNIPVRYKLRRVQGEPVPQHVRKAMERSPESWKVRNQSKCRFVPWPIEEQIEKPHTIDPETGIWPIREWSAACGRGFVSDSRFGPNQPVIRRTSRAVTRKMENAQ